MTEESFDDLLRRAGGIPSEDPGDHPEVEELALYLDGFLGEQRHQEIMDHLGRCSQCTQNLLYLEKTTNEMLADTSELEQVEKQPLSQAAESAAKKSPLFRFFQGWALATSLACLLLTFLLFREYTAKPDNMLDPAGFYTADLFPAADLTFMSESPSTQIELPAGSNWLVLHLNVTSPSEQGDFKAKLSRLDESEPVLIVEQSLVFNETGFFTMVAHRERLGGGGRFEVELIHNQKNSSQENPKYIFEVRVISHTPRTGD